MVFQPPTDFEKKKQKVTGIDEKKSEKLDENQSQKKSSSILVTFSWNFNFFYKSGTFFVGFRGTENPPISKIPNFTFFKKIRFCTLISRLNFVKI